MIKVNGVEIIVRHFPDNTQILNIPVTTFFHGVSEGIEIEWKYENDEECMTLFYAVKHIKNMPGILSELPLKLRLMYLPNARMDRVKNADEVFTLKYFSDFINSLGFSEVYLCDVHSDTGRGMINRNLEYPVNSCVQKVIDKIILECGKAPVLYFPDNGARKRYDYLVKLYGKNGVIFGEKVREWETGKILGLQIKEESNDTINSLKDTPVLMIDDIISYGGTMKYSAEELKRLGAKDTYIYCTHLENSVLDKEKGTLLPLLNDGTIKTLYTTNSLFTLCHDRIEIFEL